MKCLQCGSQGCGLNICRFSGLTHAEYREQQRINDYANAGTKRDAVARHEGRFDPDTSCSGLPLKPGT
jgi:hypothetical protein